MEEIKISVRGLVEFILRSGNIDNRKRSSSESAMLDGGRVHRMIQRRMGAGYLAEVPLKIEIEGEKYLLIVEGRADGIFAEKRKANELDPCDEKVDITWIDEIKGVHRNVKKMDEALEVHLAQAKCYGAIYLIQNNLEEIGVQMTYCNMDSEEIKRFRYTYRRDEIVAWFDTVVAEYKKWADFRFDFRKKRQESIQALEFPFEYRDGQKELAASVYRTIYHKKRLFLEAPTGVGKTISTLFPAIKALGEDKGEVIFYLTAKTLTGTVATNTYNILRQKGLRMKTVTITAKEKLCPLEQMECNPDACPYANGHFDRINDAMFELLNDHDDFSREIILEYANKHMVCPFEFCLDMSLFSDGILCDYNYLFDPNVYLRRFFQDGVKGQYIFLVDEAHNLIDRAREMYSASLFKADFLAASRLVKPFDEKLSKAFRSCNNVLLSYLREYEDAHVRESIDTFLISLTRCAGLFDEFMDQDEGSSIRDELLEFYFDMRHFLNMAELMGDDFVIYTQPDSEKDLMLKLLCVDPSSNLRACLDRGVSTIFFSATLLPVTYYIDLLSGDRNDYAIYAESSFDPAKRGVYIARDVSSKYTRRGMEEYLKIGKGICDIVKKKQGNYMVFFPSYRFMEEVYDTMLSGEMEDYSDYMQIVCQEPSMSEQQREEFLGLFDTCMKDSHGKVKDVPDLSLSIDFDIEMDDRSLVGFCVMGGIFSEGIDLKNDSLIGAIIVGTGLPQVGSELEFMKDFFDRRGGNGFDYVYRIPGMNKVLQSAGRVIRTADDVGIVALFDDRFMSSSYKNMFPHEWEDLKCGKMDEIVGYISEFWKKNQKK